jgi:hypothetical protein
VVTVIRRSARCFCRFTPKFGDLLGSIAHAPSGGSSSLKPSIAVPPFTNMSCDHEKENFADGMVEEIIPWSAVSGGTCFWPPMSRVG